MLDDESMMVYGVAETHLIGDEEPPIHPHWHWSGQNHAPNGRKGGGIGLLWKAGTSWTRLDCPCSEHMWVTGDILGIPVLLGVAYLAVHPSSGIVLRQRHWECTALQGTRGSTPHPPLPSALRLIPSSAKCHLSSLRGSTGECGARDHPVCCVVANPPGRHHSTASVGTRDLRQRHQIHVGDDVEGETAPVVVADPATRAQRQRCCTR